MYLTRYLLLHPLPDGGSLAVNGLSGAVDWLDARASAQVQALRAGESGPCDADLIEGLRKRGYLFDDPADEQQILASLWRGYAERAEGRAIQFTLCPTYACNLRCGYCFEGDLPQRARGVMTPAMAEAAFTAISGLRQQHKQQPVIGLFGGEPFLPATRGVIATILERAAQEGLPIVAVSNGVAITSHFAPLLDRYRASLSLMQITLDGPPDAHNRRRPSAAGGSFDAVVAGVEFLLERGVRVRLRTNVDAETLPLLPELADFIHARGWPARANFRASLAPVTDHLNRGDNPLLMGEVELVRRLGEMMLEQPRVKATFQLELFRVLSHIAGVLELQSPSVGPKLQYCEANSGEQLLFGPDGLVYACGEVIGRPEYALGSYHPALNLDPDRVALWMGRSVLTIPKCRDCEVALFCGGGCAYAAFAQHGTPHEPACNDAPRVLAAYLADAAARLAR